MKAIVFCPKASDARYKIGNAAHPSCRGTEPLLGPMIRIFLQFPLRVALSPILGRAEVCIVSSWEDEADVLCALITVSQFAGILILSLSLSLHDAGRWESSCSPRCRLDSSTGRAVGVSQSSVIRSQHQIMPGLLSGPALAVSRFCSLKLNHLHLCMSLSDHRQIAALHIVQPSPYNTNVTQDSLPSAQHPPAPDISQDAIQT